MTDKCLVPMQRQTCTHRSTHTHYTHLMVLSLRSQDVFACFQVLKVRTAIVGLKADGGQLMEEGRGVEGGGVTNGLGPDPTVLSDFFRHCQGHQTVSQTRAAVVSELTDGR